MSERREQAGQLPADPDPDGSAFRREIHHVADLHRIRRHLAAWLRAGSSSSAVSSSSEEMPDHVLTVQLIASELVTNAFEHGGGDSVVLNVADCRSSRHHPDSPSSEPPRDQRLLISVSHELGSDAADFEVERAMPSVDSTRSRGLALVGKLAESIERHCADDRLTVSAVIRTNQPA